ncbi:NAD(P)/FAD-dependent oxidoreductase [Zavarzinia sp. CC-PAN008]|uniref:NAD(P)/FAD-dependent oxidoreductase n=1 Tax=Zavarzinia sp. CC-PAN008 TaxID=3243332 RepID=UPI003F74877A
MDRIEAVVVGAGVVGLAVARRLAQAGLEVVVLEAEATFGSVTSARNSEVIHAGIYYPRDSLKARTCVAGRRVLYPYCAARGIAHRRLGKLIVATSDAEVATLETLKAAGEANGVEGLDLIDGAAARALEPALAARAAVVSPTSGIVDSHGLMLSLLGEAEAAGAALATRAPVERVVATDRGFDVQVGGAEPMRLGCRVLVNAAGLGAPDLAARIEGLPARHVPTQYLSRGCYFSLRGRAPFRHLIYPVPRSASLGTHLTLDLGGQARFGPDQEWIQAIGYDVDPARADVFYTDIRRYWPGLPDGVLDPAYAGIRPKLQAPGQAFADFRVDGAEVHGLPGLVNLFGIESPGLTASLALADLVAGRLGQADSVL